MALTGSREVLFRNKASTSLSHVFTTPLSQTTTRMNISKNTATESTATKNNVFDNVYDDKTVTQSNGVFLPTASRPTESRQTSQTMQRYTPAGQTARTAQIAQTLRFPTQYEQTMQRYTPAGQAAQTSQRYTYKQTQYELPLEQRLAQARAEGEQAGYEYAANGGGPGGAEAYAAERGRADRHEAMIHETMRKTGCSLDEAVHAINRFENDGVILTSSH
ncbi:hypothetical protein BJ878DRAFT_478368 [Calycina marina]|uniref:Uncharacterized protein n=1 Tax=Calycina marina TaxID=1763456 RepID=A0A9P7Z6P2_9HELO|nr:hypothetical protein BJ878DRAFT_478368 [Calycina marina]